MVGRVEAERKTEKRGWTMESRSGKGRGRGLMAGRSAPRGATCHGAELGAIVTPAWMLSWIGADSSAPRAVAPRCVNSAPRSVALRSTVQKRKSFKKSLNMKIFRKKAKLQKIRPGRPCWLQKPASRKKLSWGVSGAKEVTGSANRLCWTWR